MPLSLEIRHFNFETTIPDSNILGVVSPWKENPTDKEKEQRVWYDIENDFSRPVLENDSSTDYIPTQYFSELIKNEGYDGIKFSSSLSDHGYNLVLFHSWFAEVAKVELYEVEKIEYEIRKHKDYYNTKKKAK